MTADQKEKVRKMVGWWLSQTWFDLRDKYRHPYTRRAVRMVRDNDLGEWADTTH